MLCASLPACLPALRAQVFLGSPLKLWASVGHWWIWHFDLSKYTEKQKPRVSQREGFVADRRVTERVLSGTDASDRAVANARALPCRLLTSHSMHSRHSMHSGPDPAGVL